MIVYTYIQVYTYAMQAHTYTSAFILGSIMLISYKRIYPYINMYTAICTDIYCTHNHTHTHCHPQSNIHSHLLLRRVKAASTLSWLKSSKVSSIAILYRTFGSEQIFENIYLRRQQVFRWKRIHPCERGQFVVS